MTKTRKILTAVLVAIFALSTILCAVVFAPENTKTANAGTTYSLSYNVSDDEWTGTNPKSYSAGDVVNFSFTNSGPMSEVIINIKDNGTDQSSSKSFMVKKSSPQTFSYTFKHDGGTVLLQSGYAEICDNTPLCVKFDLNNGSSTSTIADVTGKWNGTSVSLPKQQAYGITRTGYEFLGWALTNDATSALSSYYIAYTDAIDGVITLYAVWEEESSGPNYLTLTAKGGTVEITFKYYAGTDAQYLTDGLANGTQSNSTWTDCKEAQNETGDVFTLTAGQSVQFKGTNVQTWCEEIMDEKGQFIAGYTPYHITMEAKTNGATVEASGDVTSLTNGVGGDVNLADAYENIAFLYLFHNCTILTKAPNLPSTTLSNVCYSHMFVGCSSLTEAPELPAKTLTEYCYGSMFKGCSSLTKAPELSATTLAPHCYSNMFYGCSSLTVAPELSATTLANYCYAGMFYRCSSLTKAPELPATTLASRCYGSMFEYCTSLTEAPKLDAETLAEGCYSDMFCYCSSLTEAPELPAKELAAYCYDGMFRYSGLLSPADISHVTSLAKGCFKSMYYGCEKIAMSTTKKAGYTIEWTVPNVSTATDWNAEMFGVIGYDNCCTGTPVAVNTTYYVAKYYNVAYDLNGGSGTIPTDNNIYRVGNEINFSDGTGFANGDIAFMGWNSSKTSTNGYSHQQISSSDVPETGDTITFYAIWKTTDKYVYIYYMDECWEYYYDGVQCDPQDVKAFNKGDEIVIKDEYACGVELKVSRKDSDSDISEEFYTEYTYTIQNDGAYVKELTANWPGYILIIDKYSIVYDANGGSGTVPTHDKSNGAVDIGETITLASGDGLTKTGASFVGWSLDKDATTGIIDTTYTIDANDMKNCEITLFAIWEEPLTVTYDANAGEDTVTNMPSDTTDYTSGATVTLATTVPVRDGYRFLGWSTDSTAKVADTFTDNKFDIAEDTTLYAVWTEKLHYTYNEDSGWDGEPETSYNAGDKIIITSNTPVVSGYLIVNGQSYYHPMLGAWTKEYTIINDGATLVLEDKDTFGRAFVTDGYTVTYDDNVADEEITVPTDSNYYGSKAFVANGKTYISGPTVTISSTEPTRTGYKFAGWNTKADGSGTTYQAAGTFTMGTSDVTLYAIWQETHICHDIEFDTTFDKNIQDKSGNGNIYSGNYFLNKNINLLTDFNTKLIIPEGEVVNICLNGYELSSHKGENYFVVYGTLNIYDCDDTEHGWKTNDYGYWVSSVESATYKTYGGYLTNCPRAFSICEGGSLGIYGVDFVGTYATTSIICNEYGTKNCSLTLQDVNILGNKVDAQGCALVYLSCSNAENIELNLTNVTISNNVAQQPVYIEGDIAVNINDNVVIKNNVYAYGEDGSTGLFFDAGFEFDSITALNVKEDVTGTEIDVSVYVDNSNFLNHDVAITKANSEDISSIFTLATYGYNGLATCEDAHYVVRNIENKDGTNTTYISRWYTVTYANIHATDFEKTIIRTTGTVTDTNHYFFGDEITLKDSNNVTVEKRYDTTSEDWGKASYTMLGWDTEETSEFMYKSADKFYANNYKTTYNFTKQYNYYTSEKSGSVDIANDITLYPYATTNTLYYNVKDGKFHYFDKNSGLVATVIDDKYTATQDADGKYTNIVFTDLNYSVDYENAIKIDASVNFNITFKGTNVISSKGYYAFSLMSDRSVVNVEGSLQLNGATEFDNTVFESGTINISLDEVANNNYYAFDAVAIQVKDGAFINIENNISEHRAFLIESITNILIYAKQNVEDEYVLYDDFVNDFDNYTESTRKVDGGKVYYNYIKIAGYSVVAPSAQNGFEVTPNAESNIQWYEDTVESFPVIYDSETGESNYMLYLDDDNYPGITFAPLTLTMSEDCVMFFNLTEKFDALSFKSKTDVDYSEDEMLKEFYDEFTSYGITLAKTYDETNDEYTYTISVVVVDGIVTAFIAPEGTVIYDLCVVNIGRAIEDANESTYEPTTSGKYFVKTTASYASYTSPTLVASSLTFDANDGTGEMSSVVNFSGASITLPSNTFTRTYYKFIGWSTTASGDVEYTDGANFTFVDDDVTLYAIWELDAIYSVIYDANTTDEVTGMPTDSTLYAKGGSAPISTDVPVRSNYVFKGWNTDASASTAMTFADGNYTMGASDVTLYAIWEAKTAVSITEKAQETTYNGNAQSFEIKGTHKDLSSFAVSYYVSGAWTTAAPTNAGKYDVKIERAEDSTYASYSKTISNGLVINKADNAITTFTMADWTYGQTASEPSASATYGTPSYTYSASKDGEYTSTKPSTAGTYYVKVVVEEGDNYKATSAKYTFTIARATYDMTNAKWNYTSAFTFDGNEKKVEVVGLPSGVTASYTDNAKTNAGSYTAKVELTYDTNNYNAISIDNLSWTINAKDITLTIEDVANGTYTYDGTAKTTTATYSGLIGTDELTYTLSYSDNVNAGTCNVSIASASISSGTATNYNLIATDTSSFVIAQREIGITWSETAFTYDGVVHKPTATATNVLSGETVALSVSGEQTTAGTYTATASFSTSQNNYVLPNAVTTEFTIARATYDMTNAKWNYASAFTFDGSAKKLEVTGLPEGVSVASYTGNEYTNAGTYKATVTLTYDSNNYNEISIEDQSWIINKAKVAEPTISFTEQYAHIYDGNTQTIIVDGVESYMSTSDSLTKTDAGSYTITYTLDNNHEWDENSDGVVEWNIIKAQAGIMEALVEGWTYGGKAKTPEVRVNFGTPVVTYSSDGENFVSDIPTNAGTYTVRITVVDDDNFDGFVEDFELGINKATYDMSGVVFANAIVTYDGTEHGIVATNLPVGLDGIAVTATYTQGLTEPGSKKIIATFHGSNNYEALDKMSAIITVKPADSDLPTTDPDEKPIIIVEDIESSDDDIVVEVKVEVVACEVVSESTELTIDYTTQLDRFEELTGVYDVKLYINGVEKQPSDIAEGTIITVKMLVPQELIGKSFRVIHVHGENDIESITLGEEAGIGTYIIDEEGYLVTKINKLSEFAFIAETECITSYFAIPLCILYALAMAYIWFVLKQRELDKLPVIVSAVFAVLLAVCLVFAHCLTCFTTIVVGCIELTIVALSYSKYALFVELFSKKNKNN